MSRQDANLTLNVKAAGIARTQNELKGLGDQVKALRQQTGGFDEVVKMMRGGAALGGISMLAQSGANIARTFREAKEELQAGKIAAGEMVDKLASGVPIFGNVWRMGREIREAVFGEQAALVRAEQAAKDSEAAWAMKLKHARETAVVFEKIAATIRRIDDDFAVMTAPAHLRSRVSGQIGERTAREGAEASAAAEIAAVRAMRDAELAPLREQQNAAADALARMRAQETSYRSARGANRASERDKAEMAQRVAEAERRAQELSDAIAAVHARHNATIEKIERGREEAASKAARNIEIQTVRAEEKAGEARAAVVAENHRTLTRMQREFHEQRLRDMGRHLQAELMQIRRMAQEAAAVRQRAAEDQQIALAGDPERQRAAQFQADAEIGLANQKARHDSQRSIVQDIAKRMRDAFNDAAGRAQNLVRSLPTPEKREPAGPPAPLIPYAPGDISIGRAAAMERAALAGIGPRGTMEANRETVRLLTGIQDVLKNIFDSVRDDTFR